jgi:BirA family biotin operon repressor/biotin-[acetyl-CoA-carboxylase] ligase
MATPYFQLRRESVPSTQDVAREALLSPRFRGKKGGTIPVLVIAAHQTEGRGRAGANWLTADRALAVSLAAEVDPEESRPLSLMAGVAAAGLGREVELKWPNDVMVGESKAGGILVERSGDVVVIGLGLNLWWRGAPEGMCGLFADDPGGDRHAELGALWGARMMRLLDDAGWPRERYKALCSTLGREVTWEPGGEGRAVDVDLHGALTVETTRELVTVRSGEIRHLRPKAPS